MWADHSGGHDHNRSYDAFAQAEACYTTLKDIVGDYRALWKNATRVLSGMIAMMVLTIAGRTTNSCAGSRLLRRPDEIIRE